MMRLTGYHQERKAKTIYLWLTLCFPDPPTRSSALELALCTWKVEMLTDSTVCIVMFRKNEVFFVFLFDTSNDLNTGV